MPADIRYVTPILKFTTEPYRLWLQRIECADENLMELLDWIERVNTALFMQFDARNPGQGSAAVGRACVTSGDG